MFAPDPINLADPAPYGAFAYYGHLLIGSVTLLAVAVALWARKGGLLHRRSGYTYMAGVAFVCLTTSMMLSQVFIGPLFMAAVTAVYAIGGAWLALQPGTRIIRFSEYGLTVLEIAALGYFLSFAAKAVSVGVIPPIAPIVIAIIPLILIAGDANWFLKPASRKRLRIARHLSRMVWGFVVVLRAPLVELAAAGLPIPASVVVVGPILLAAVMIWYFRRKFIRNALVSA